MENATSQFDKIIRNIQERKIKKRWRNQYKIRLELWIDDALGWSRWVGWSSKMTAPSHKQNFLFIEVFLKHLLGWALHCERFFLRKRKTTYIKQEQNETNNSDSLNEKP